MSNTKEVMLKGMFWVSVDKYSSLVLNILVSMVLARLLQPSEFGTLTLASVCLVFISMLSGMGLGPAIVQQKELSQKDIDSVFTFSSIVGFFLALVYFFLSWPIASFYKDSQLIPICQLLSLSFFISTLNGVPSALMSKNQRFKEVAIRSFVLNLISGPISICAALGGCGVYSLMISPFVNSIGVFLFNRRYYPCNIDYHFSMAPIKRMASFSIFQFLFDFVNYFSRNIDKLIIGKWISMTDLGYYDKAYRLMQMPQANITSIIVTVLQPSLAQYQDDKPQMATKYLKLLSTMAAISFPLGMALCMCGHEIIRVFYGANWDLAVPCFQILALSLPTMMLNSTTGAIYQASNATKQLFIAGLVNSIVVVVGFFIASYYWSTIEAVAMSWTVLSLFTFAFTFSLMFIVVFNSSVLFVLRILLKPLINSFLLLVVLYFFDVFFLLPTIYSLISKLLVAGLITLLYMQFSGEFDIFNSFFKLFKKCR